MRWRVAIFGTLGAVATVVGAAFALAPDLLLGVALVEETVNSLDDTGPKSVMTGAAAVVGVYVLASARSTGRYQAQEPASDADARFDAARTSPPEAVTADRRTATGAGLDADVQAAIERGGEPLRTLRDLLRELAAEAWADDARQTDTEARRAVETGEWTDDRVAAAFLAGEGGPTPSLLSRVRLWLAPEGERARRVDATLAGLEELQEDRR